MGIWGILWEKCALGKKEKQKIHSWKQVSMKNEYYFQSRRNLPKNTALVKDITNPFLEWISVSTFQNVKP